MLNKPQLDEKPIHTIVKTDDLAAHCLRWAKETYITVDTEFLRETTYYPKLCLIQVAGAEEAALIDPLADGIDLAPFLRSWQTKMCSRFSTPPSRILKF